MVFSRKGKKSGYKKVLTTLLFTNVKFKGQMVADHIWFTQGKQFENLDLQGGDVVVLKARVDSYIKGYFGRRDNFYNPPSIDYRLVNPTKIRKIGKEKILMNENITLIKYSNKNGNFIVKFDFGEKNVWLTQEEMAKMFGLDTKAISNVISAIEKRDNFDYQKQINKVEILDKEVNYYSLDVVKNLAAITLDDSCIVFTIWSDKILSSMKASDYLLITINQDNFDFVFRCSKDYQEIWLSQSELAEFFGTSEDKIAIEINNILMQYDIYNEKICNELLIKDENEVCSFVKCYNFDIINLLANRIKSTRSIAFCKWRKESLEHYINTTGDFFGFTIKSD